MDFKQRLKNFGYRVAAKAVVVAAGVNGFIAQKFWQYAIVYIAKAAYWMLQKYTNEQITNREKTQGDQYEKSLKDGVSGKEQDDALIDFLNGGLS